MPEREYSMVIIINSRRTGRRSVCWGNMTYFDKVRDKVNSYRMIGAHKPLALVLWTPMMSYSLSERLSRVEWFQQFQFESKMMSKVLTTRGVVETR
jgi:hypothetical protein